MVWIRDAGREEASVLAELIRTAFLPVARRFGITRENCPTHPSGCTRERVSESMERGHTYLVLGEAETLRGCVCLEYPEGDPPLCYLERLAVEPGFTGRGHGRALVEAALARARADGVRRVGVAIVATHTELRAWYGRLGFAEDETRRFDHLPFPVTFLSRELPEEGA